MTTRSSKSTEHPLLPGEANTLLAVVTFLFASSGVLVLLGVVMILGGKLVGWEYVEGMKVRVLGLVITLAVAIGYMATAWLLSRRRRLGGVLGVGFICLSFGGDLSSLDPISVADVLWPAGLLLALALSWSHLSSAGRPPADH